MSSFIAPEINLKDTDSWLQQIIDDLEKIGKKGGAMPIESIELCESFLEYGVPVGPLTEIYRKKIAAKAMIIVHQLGLMGHNEKSPLVIGFMKITNQMKSEQWEIIQEAAQETRDRVQMHFNYATVFWDGICHSIWPHMQEREERYGIGWDKDDELGDSLKNAVIQFICKGNLPELRYLGDSRLDDLREALPGIKEKLQSPLFFDTKITPIAVQKIDEFLKALK